MNNTQPLLGAILKIERVKQERSQKEVCHGICVPSYLSKIEYGTVRPDEEILQKLYKRLQIEFIGEGELLDNLQRMLEDYFYRLEYELETKDLYAELYLKDRQLSFSRLAIDWLIIKQLQGEDTQASLSLLKENMSPLQRAYYYIYDMAEFTDMAEKVTAQESAANIINRSFAFILLCQSYMHTSDYAKIHQLENRVIALALDEGNTFQLAEYYFLNGTAYACVNMEEMMVVNYERTIHLLQNTKWTDGLDMLYYNMGATYISLKKYDLALEYLHKANKAQDGRKFSTNQKIAITYIRSGALNKAKKILEKMEKELLKEYAKDSLEYLMYEEACWECREDFLCNAEYLGLLEKLIKKIKKERHFGYLYFYQDVISAAYTNQRQYKKALEFQKNISFDEQKYLV